MENSILVAIKNHKKLVVILVIIAIVLFYFFNPFKKEKEEFILEKVMYGTIIQEVSETGSVEPPHALEMGFKTSGRIERINVKIGDLVQKGQELAKIETSQLYIQFQDAQASLKVSQAQYNKLLAGYTPEEIKITEDAKETAEQNLSSAYQSALNVLNDSYLKIYNAYNLVDSLQQLYFGGNDQIGIDVRESKTKIDNAMSLAKPLIDSAKISRNQNDINQAVSQTISSLEDVSDALNVMRGVCDDAVYYNKVSSANKTLLDDHKSYIFIALTNTNNSQQTIALNKIAFQKAQNELILKIAEPRQEDIDLYQAQISQAEAKANLLQRQIFDSTLRAPIAGIITNIDKKTGEIAQATDMFMSLMSQDPLQIKVNIYEEDINKIKEDNIVDIKIAALSNGIYTGRVIAINPAEKIIDQIVYYKITIGFDQIPEGLKSGMTVDVVIQTAKKENVLIVSKEAIKENGEMTLSILKNGNMEEREIQIGLEGNENKVEIISGVSEGEEVVIK